MRKVFTGKNLEEVLEQARAEFGVEKRELHYTILGEVKKLFSKKIEVECFTTSEVVKQTEQYVKQLVESIDVKLNSISTVVNNREFRMKITSSDDALIIGKNGKNLQAFTELARAFASSKYKMRFNIIIDVSDYKDSKYEKLEKMAQRIAKEVMATKTSAKLDHMSNDERKAVHQALSGMANIKTESEGEGKYRCLVIKYVDHK